MKKIYFLIIVTAIHFSMFAQSGAKIVFKTKDNTIDYGTVSKDSDNGIRFFEFTNSGDEPLIIKNVLSTCGCTIPSWPKDPIIPGNKGKIEVKYNMAAGPIRKTITVETNAINYPEGRVSIKIKGEVIVKEPVNLLEKKKATPTIEN